MLLILIISFYSFFQLHAHDGELDPAFNGTGFVYTNLFPGPTLGTAGLAVQADGKIIAGFSQTVNSSFSAVIARYNSDGSLDSSFGPTGTGTAITPTSVGFQIFALTLQTDGSIILAGQDGSTPAVLVVRYSSAGILDQSFGTAGIATIPFTNSLDAFFLNWGLVVQADGGILVSGATDSVPLEQYFLLRLTPSGSLDTSFGTGGIIIDSFLAGEACAATSVVVQPDRKIVIGGMISPQDDQAYLGLARYMPDGTLDITFGTAGKVALVSATQSTVSTSIRLLSNGKIVSGGALKIGTSIMCMVCQFLPNGSIDTSFGVNGFQIINTPSPFGLVSSIAIQFDGSIIAVGTEAANGNFSNPTFITSFRLFADGSLDSSYGTDGLARFQFNESNIAYVIVATCAQKIYISGFSGISFNMGDGNDILILQLTNTGLQFSPLTSAVRSKYCTCV